MCVTPGLLLVTMALSSAPPSTTIKNTCHTAAAQTTDKSTRIPDEAEYSREYTFNTDQKLGDKTQHALRLPKNLPGCARTLKAMAHPQQQTRARAASKAEPQASQLCLQRVSAPAECDCPEACRACCVHVGLPVIDKHELLRRQLQVRSSRLVGSRSRLAETLQETPPGGQQRWQQCSKQARSRWCCGWMWLSETLPPAPRVVEP